MAKTPQFDRDNSAGKRRRRGRAAYPTGFAAIDEAFGGLRRSELAVFAGGPATGKTEALVRVAEHLAVPTMVFTCDPESASRFRMCAERPDLYLDATGQRRFSTIVESVERARETLGVRVVLIDDLQLADGTRYPLELGAKRFASELKVAVLVSWTVPPRSAGNAHWSDLRGTVVEDPDLLMLVQGVEVVPPATRFACFNQNIRRRGDPFVHERLCFGV